MRKLLLFISVSLCMIPHLTSGQWIQQGGDIDGEAAGDNAGRSVSLSNDGSIIAIGASGNDGNGDASGHVRIYEFDGLNWIQLGQDIDGEFPNTLSGYSVSLSGNGSTVAIGAYLNDENGPNSGQVRIYQFNGVNWIQLGQDILGDFGGDYAGWSVSLSHDGSIAAIGARGNDGNGMDSGQVRVFQFDGVLWNQLGQDIDGEAAHDFSGASVSLSSDGSIVAIGAYWNSGNGPDSGHVRVYQFNGVNWVQVGQDIDGEAGGDNSGRSVSLSSDGSIVAIGAYWNDGNGQDSGHARVFQFDGATWNQLGQDIDGEAAQDFSGYSVSLNDNGNVIAIGALNNDGNGDFSGHVRIYEFDGAAWNQVGQDIDGEAPLDSSGEAVSLNGDGSMVAIGAVYNDGNGPESGHVRIYTNPWLSYTEVPDPVFEQALIDQGIDSEGILNALVLTSDLAGVSNLNVANLGITDLTGIEAFASLINLGCHGNLLTGLNLTHNVNLRRLYCQNNQLSTLNVSENTVLQVLYAQGNQLTHLDVTGLNVLTTFNAGNNPGLTCIAVDDPVSAAAQTGLYDGWIVDDLMVYANSCGMMAKSATPPEIKNIKNKSDEKVGMPHSVTVYPNPVSHTLHLVLPSETRPVKVSVYNMQGEEVATGQTANLSLSHLAAGIYMVRIETRNNGLLYRKIIVSGE